MAFIPCVRKTLDLSRALTALQPQRTAIVPCKCVQVCPCSTARLPQQRFPLTSPQLPLIQMDDFNKISFTPVEHKSHAWGWALPQAESHQGWLLDTIFIPDTQSLQQSSLHGSVPAAVPRLVMAEAFCLCPSSTALAGQSPAIFLCTFSSRQQDPAFQCHGIPLKIRVMVQLCSTSQGQLIQTLQKSSHFNYSGSMGETNTYWSYGDSSLPPTSPAAYRGEWTHKDVGQVNDLTLTWLCVLHRWWDLACEVWLIQGI